MKAKAPGKLIFSGEHAVVHGRPALVMAIDRFVETQLVPTTTGQCRIDAAGILGSDTFPMAALAGLKQRLDHQYGEFLNGTRAIRAVVQDAIDLGFYTVAYLLERNDWPSPDGLDITVAGDLPIGAGMGSSAAVVAALLTAAAGELGLKPDRNTLYRWTLDIERLQHGHPSGVDPFIVVHGGLVRFQHGEANALHVPRRAFDIVMTGTPASSTGECVAHVSHHFPSTDPIWAAFTAVTEAMEMALTEESEEDLVEAVRENHRLLCRIGVVPERVQQFVKRVEAVGGAAKCCGAGAISGDGGGIALLIGGEATRKIVQDFNYRHSSLRAVHGGSECMTD